MEERTATVSIGRFPACARATVPRKVVFEHTVKASAARLRSLRRPTSALRAGFERYECPATSRAPS